MFSHKKFLVTKQFKSKKKFSHKFLQLQKHFSHKKNLVVKNFSHKKFFSHKIGLVTKKKLVTTKF